MAKMIKADNVFKVLFYDREGRPMHSTDCDNFDVTWPLKDLKHILCSNIVDAEPVVHAHWIRKGPTGKCSACGHTEFSSDLYFGNYCRECGAVMDEEEKGEVIQNDSCKKQNRI